MLDQQPEMDGDRFVDQWRFDGPATLRANHVTFRAALEKAKASAQAGDLAYAAALCEIVASHAIANHCGLFASQELEAVVASIARAALGGAAIPRGTADGGRPRRILHVATCVQAVGGLSRMIWRWIEVDTGGVHSLALVRQRRAVPKQMIETVRRSGGQLHDLSHGPDGLLDLARGLRQAAAGADLIVLHIGNQDVVPLLAFSGATSRPPIAYLDHADHAFWLGVSIADVVIGLRASGVDLAVARRGVDPVRSVLLPIPLDDVERTFSRREAKRRLGHPEDALILLSVARAVKYRSVAGQSYANVHLPFLQRHGDAALVVLGSGRRDDWETASAQVGGRIIGLPESEDTALHYQAADIYVDSFPFVSTTSLLEAGRCGTPLVSRYPFPPGAEILSADMPGLMETLQRPRTAAAYRELLSRLAADAAVREELGQATWRGIAALHGGPAWRAALDKVYALSARVPPAPPSHDRRDAPSFSVPDVFIPFVHGGGDPDILVSAQLHLMPAARRARHSVDLALRRGPNFDGRFNLWKCWIPSRVVARFR